MSSQIRSERLATLPNFREQIVVRPAPLRERLGQSRRLEALQRLFANAKRKPVELYELQTAQPKRRMPDEVLRTMIHDGIRAGYITREQVVVFRAAQLIDDFGAFPGAPEADDATYRAMVREVGEALDEATVHHGLPSPTTRESMRREVLEAAAVMQLHVAVIEQGR